MVMELQFELESPLLEGASNTFLAVRVGDVQKQSKITGVRSFRFPDSTDGQGATPARVEIFQRVGYTNLNLDGFDSEQNIYVPCKFTHGARDVSFRFVTKGAARMDAISAEKKSHARRRMDEARNYLHEHHIEDSVADVMRELIRNKPEDPHAFLANELYRRSDEAGRGGKLPTIPQASSRAEAMPLDSEMMSLRATHAEAAWRPPPVYEARSMQPKERLAPLKSAPSLPEPMQLPCETFPPVAADRKYPPDVALTETTALRHLPSVGTWLMRRPASSKVRFVPTFSHQPSVASWLTHHSEAAASALAKARKAADEILCDYQFKPSVGGWLARIPHKVEMPKYLQDYYKEKEEIVCDFEFKPSVGGWLAAKPPKVEAPWYFKDYKEEEIGESAVDLVTQLQELIREREKELWALKAQLSGVVVKLPSKQSAPPGDEDAVEELPGAPGEFAEQGAEGQPGQVEVLIDQLVGEKPFELLPSVGSWLTLRRKDTAVPGLDVAEEIILRDVANEPVGPTPWMLLPSVGTWLSSPAPEIEEVPEPSILERSESELLLMPQKELVRGFLTEIKKRDAEIKTLRIALGIEVEEEPQCDTADQADGAAHHEEPDAPVLAELAQERTDALGEQEDHDSGAAAEQKELPADDEARVSSEQAAEPQADESKDQLAEDPGPAGGDTGAASAEAGGVEPEAEGVDEQETQQAETLEVETADAEVAEAEALDAEALGAEAGEADAVEADAVGAEAGAEAGDEEPPEEKAIEAEVEEVKKVATTAGDAEALETTAVDAEAGEAAAGEVATGDAQAVDVEAFGAEPMDAETREAGEAEVVDAEAAPADVGETESVAVEAVEAEAGEVKATETEAAQPADEQGNAQETTSQQTYSLQAEEEEDLEVEEDIEVVEDEDDEGSASGAGAGETPAATEEGAAPVQPSTAAPEPSTTQPEPNEGQGEPN